MTQVITPLSFLEAVCFITVTVSDILHLISKEDSARECCGHQCPLQWTQVRESRFTVEQIIGACLITPEVSRSSETAS